MPAPNQQPPVMAEDAPAAAPPQGDQSTTVEVPAAAIGAAQEGDTVQFKVVSVDQQNGTATIAPAPGTPESEMGGADGMADEFSNEKIQPKGVPQ